MTRSAAILLLLGLAGCATASTMPIPQGQDWFFLGAPPVGSYFSYSRDTRTVGDYEVTTTTTESGTWFAGTRAPGRPPVRWRQDPGHPELLRGRTQLAEAPFRPLEALP